MKRFFDRLFILRSWGGGGLVAVAAILCTLHLLPAAPLPPMDKVTIAGTIAEVKWIPEISVKGKKGWSGSLGRDRVFPAHFEVTLRDYSGPKVDQAWMMNGFMSVERKDTEDRSKLPPTLEVWVNSEDQDDLKAGMNIRLVNYMVTGDEGGTWTSCERVEKLGSPPPDGSDVQPSKVAPRNFSARIGGMLGATFKVELHDGGLVYSKMHGRKASDPIKITPTSKQWREFRAALDDLKVWQWEPEHMNRKIMDGTQWALEIEYPDCKLKAIGSNSYPDENGKPNGRPEMTPSFQRYLSAVENLLGGKSFK